MSEKKLKPCPFCGSEAELRKAFEMMSQPKKFWIECTVCDIGTKYNPTEKDAIRTWNKRT